MGDAQRRFRSIAAICSPAIAVLNFSIMLGYEFFVDRSYFEVIFLSLLVSNLVLFAVIKIIDRMLNQLDDIERSGAVGNSGKMRSRTRRY